MKILITGTAGFIGFHLVEALLQHENINVVGIDNINDYYDVNLKYDRLLQSGVTREKIVNCANELYIVQSEKHSNYQFTQLDITNLTVLEELFKKEQFTHVINLAAQAGVRYSLENPHAYVQSNLVGFVNLLECCRHNKIKHFVYASSSSVYGANAKIPFSENDQVDSPVSLYAATKKSNELMAYTYSHLYDLPTTGLRFFTVYGAYGRPDMSPMLFANAIHQDKPIKVFNNGEMQRDFTYIDDIVQGVMGCVMTLPNNTPKAEVFNIGNSQPVDLMTFISTLEKYMGKEAEKVFMPMQDGDVKRTWADTQKLQNQVNYQPKTTLDYGIEQFITWFKVSGYNYQGVKG